MPKRSKPHDLVVTHFAMRASSLDTWVPLPCVLRSATDEGDFYYTDSHERRDFQKITPEMVSSAIREGALTAVSGNPQPYVRDTRLWLSPPEHYMFMAARDPEADTERMPLMDIVGYNLHLKLGCCPPFEEHPSVAQWRHYISLLLEETDPNHTVTHSNHPLLKYLYGSKPDLARRYFKTAFDGERVTWEVMRMPANSQMRAQQLSAFVEKYSYLFSPSTP